jgi:hypothetical protein
MNAATILLGQKHCGQKDVPDVFVLHLSAPHLPATSSLAGSN